MDIFFSRKFLALVLATVVLFYNKIGEYTWGAVVGLYLGANLLDSKIKKKNMEGESNDKPNL
jgi:hypothetical protein